MLTFCLMCDIITMLLFYILKERFYEENKQNCRHNPPYVYAYAVYDNSGMCGEFGAAECTLANGKGT